VLRANRMTTSRTIAIDDLEWIDALRDGYNSSPRSSDSNPSRRRMPHMAKGNGHYGHGNWNDQRLLGKHFIDIQREAVLKIGKTVWTRQDMVRPPPLRQLQCGPPPHPCRPRAGRRQAQEMASRVSLEDLFKVRDVGVTTVYVWLCILEGMNKNPYNGLTALRMRS
jgi:hypothetical protein